KRLSVVTSGVFCPCFLIWHSACIKLRLVGPAKGRPQKRWPAGSLTRIGWVVALPLTTLHGQCVVDTSGTPIFYARSSSPRPCECMRPALDRAFRTLHRRDFGQIMGYSGRQT